ncbi:GNAT family N-acetyltransferase [Streptomyces sp. BH-SS-21]|uniref:GNAT family N-acetyltransferase n=1 Tax=Streptomyces liliiviolaceus TaxID=2823109 RepID=A0A940XUR5_9ACTN|nr:GNAT family N-acetyltransferase [Streptomyces liliiviolaceus]MBQ0847311.1 GNAT family N-acetyltransferase [Streptomyces liliiviolaceus]
MTDLYESSGSLPHPEIRGHGLRLRPWDPDTEGDVQAWLRGYLDPEFQRWNTPLKPIEGRADAQESMAARVKAAQEGVGASFCVTDATGGVPLGHVGINDIDHVIRVARVGYWVLPDARGRQVATRALALASRWAFEELGLHRLELGHALGHEASCRIAERCGYPAEGTLRGAMFESGRLDAFRDVHLHGRLATDPATDLEPAPVLP